MKKTIAKSLSVVLALCILMSAFPVLSASAAVMRSLSFTFESLCGLVREEYNRTEAESGSSVTIYAFPADGYTIDTVTITDVTNNRTVAASSQRIFEGGTGYTFTMPNGNVNVAVVFKVDNANGYYKVNYNYIGNGTATFHKNGMSTEFHTAHAGDQIKVSNPVPGEGYIFDRFHDNTYYTTADGTRTKVILNDPFSMPWCDITINVCFTEAHPIGLVASGGTAISCFDILGFTISPSDYALTGSDEGRSIAVIGTADSDHLSTFKFRVETASGASVPYSYSQGSDFDVATFTMPDEPVTAYLTFLKDNYAISCSAENGTLSYSAPDGTGYGERIELSFTANDHYELQELYYTYTPEAGMDAVRVDVDPDDPVFDMPEADVAVNAVFAPLYKVEWLDGDDSLLDIKTYRDGEPIPTTDKIPTKESTWECDYVFAGWSNPLYYTGNLVLFRPIFDKVYSVTIGGGTAQPAKAKAGTLITLTPDEALAGMYHTGWKVTSGDFEVTGNTFIMPASNVTLHATYALKETVDIDLVLSDPQGYVGKPIAASGSIKKDGEVLNVGGDVTVIFSSGTPDTAGAISLTVPVENGLFSVNVPALTAGINYVWAEYSGDGHFGEALASWVFRVYDISQAGLDGFYGETPVKTHYAAGEALNTDNLILWIFWNDATEEEIPVTANMVSGYDCYRPGWQTLTVACPYPCPNEEDLTYDVYVQGVLLGDANGDNAVDILDATTIQRHLAELENLDAAHLLAADTNQDGEIDISDATHLQMFLAEYFESSPIGTLIGI